MFSGRIATSTLSPADVARGKRDVERRSRRPSSTLPAPARASSTLPETRLTRPMKSATSRLAGLRIDLMRRAVLLQPSAVHDGDLVGQRERFGLIVGDIDEGDAGAALEDCLSSRAHALAQLGVEVGERLVEQENFRLDHEAARKRDALLLAAGELVGIALLEPGEVDQRERLRDFAPRLGRAGLCAASVRTRRSRTRSCAATPRSSGTPCPCRGRPAARRCRARRPAGRRRGWCRRRARCSRRSAAASWSCRSRSGPSSVTNWLSLDVEIEIGHRREASSRAPKLFDQALDRDASHQAVTSRARAGLGDARRRRACWRRRSRRR